MDSEARAPHIPPLQLFLQTLGFADDDMSDREMVERLERLETARDEHLRALRRQEAEEETTTEEEENVDATTRTFFEGEQQVPQSPLLPGPVPWSPRTCARAASSSSPAPMSTGRSDSSEDDDRLMCAVCYGAKCHPTKVSPACSHTFCRLCAFKGRMWEAGCPMCRAALAPELRDMRFPGEMDFDAEADTEVAARMPSAHREAAEKEAAFEASLREKHVAGVPLIKHPGSLPTADDGRPYRLKVGPKTVLTVTFSERAAKEVVSRAASTGGWVGVVYPATTQMEYRGFLARAVRTEPGAVGAGLKVKLGFLSKFTFDDRDVRQDPLHGHMVSDVTLTD